VSDEGEGKIYKRMRREKSGKERERERENERIAMLTVQMCLHKCMLLRALGAQPRRRKPAFVTQDNEASLCVNLNIARMYTCCLPIFDSIIRIPFHEKVPAALCFAL